MADKIDYTSPPVEGPFTITYLFCPQDQWGRRDAQWEQRKTTKDDEREAVRFWGRCLGFENMRPVSITPEPRWNRYTYDGRTPLSR